MSEVIDSCDPNSMTRMLQTSMANAKPRDEIEMERVVGLIGKGSKVQSSALVSPVPRGNVIPPGLHPGLLPRRKNILVRSTNTT